MSASISLRFRDSLGDHQHLLEAEKSIIGRTEECDIQITDDTISRNHAQILKQGDSFVLEDLNSRNGVFANNRPIKSITLHSGMVLRLGNVSILVDSLEGSSLDVRLTDDRPEQGVLDSLIIDDFQSSFPMTLGAGEVGQSQEGLGVALELFQNAAETLLTGSELSEVTAGAVGLALRSLPVDRGFLSLKEDGQLVPHATQAKGGLDSNRPMQISRTIAKQVMEDRAAVLIRDTGSMEDLAVAHSIVQMHIQSAMCAPLVSGNEVVGIIYVDCVDSKKSLTSNHLGIISVLALMVSSALEQFRLHQSVKEEKRRREQLSCRLSPNVVEKVIAGEAELGSKEAEITVLFADLVGFTSMSEKLAPREVVDLLNELFETLTAEVFDQDGTLDKYIGDALIAFFGAPEEQDDHAARAIRTGIAMQKRLQEMADQHPDRPPLSMRIGINSGPAVVGDIGSKLRSDYTVIGDTVNTASRLESQVAQSGEVVIGPKTAALCADEFQLEQLKTMPLKGKSKPVQPWRVIGAK
ncbi:MAG: adenylate/guanylate cyclase domain-containing protein [Planctomycetota bacterium]|nr:adenylate/guanylate cyclase domain-containing protein [Planctomycetota bacterium]